MNNQYGHNYRGMICVCLILLAFAGLMMRSLYLCYFYDHKRFAPITRQYATNLKTASYRGNIYDRHKHSLAVSVQRPSAYIDKKFKPTLKQLGQIALILDVPKNKIKKLIKKKRAFAYLKRKISPKQKARLERLELKGLAFQTEPHRVYPNGQSAAELLGFVDIDNKGLAGVEKQFDRQLTGQITKVSPAVDALRRRILLDNKSSIPDHPGNNIILSIDQVIQEIAEEALKWGVERSLAKGGWVVVADPNTGAILAAANYTPYSGKAKKLQRNRAFVDIWEPGSLTKAMLLTSALDKKAVSLNQEIDCSKGKMKIGKHTIHDTHLVKDATITDVIVHSSNVCAYKIAEKVGAKNYYNHLIDFGIADKKYSFQFPGYTAGRISHYKKWRPIRFANIAFGQGFLTNTIELVRAFSTVGNGGRLFDPYLLERVETDSGVIQYQKKPSFTQLFEPHVAQQIKGVLEKVVQEGSGRNAKIKGLGVGGKTGTAQKTDPGKRGYAKGKYLASFFGFTPTKSTPHLTIGVVIDTPGKAPHYGGLWAAPVFKKIAKTTLKYLNLSLIHISEPTRPY